MRKLKTTPPEGVKVPWQKEPLRPLTQITVGPKDTEEHGAPLQEKIEQQKEGQMNYIIGVDTVTTPSIVSTAYVVSDGKDIIAIFRVDSKPEDPALLRDMEEMLSKHYEGCKIISEKTCLLKKRK